MHFFKLILIKPAIWVCKRACSWWHKIKSLLDKYIYSGKFCTVLREFHTCSFIRLGSFWHWNIFEYSQPGRVLDVAQCNWMRCLPEGQLEWIQIVRWGFVLWGTFHTPSTMDDFRMCRRGMTTPIPEKLNIASTQTSNLSHTLSSWCNVEQLRCDTSPNFPLSFSRLPSREQSAKSYFSGFSPGSPSWRLQH